MFKVTITFNSVKSDDWAETLRFVTVPTSTSAGAGLREDLQEDAEAGLHLRRPQGAGPPPRWTPVHRLPGEQNTGSNTGTVRGRHNADLLWLQIETIGKKVTTTRIPYTPAAVCARTPASEPPAKKAKVWSWDVNALLHQQEERVLPALADPCAEDGGAEVNQLSFKNLPVRPALNQSTVFILVISQTLHVHPRCRNQTRGYFLL